MRFAPSIEQEELRDLVRDLMVKRCPPAVVRSAPRSPSVDRLAAELVALGAPALLVPTSLGGLELDENYLVVLLEESGRAAAPLPLVDTVGFAPGLLQAVGLLERVLDGRVLVVADPAARGCVRYGSSAGLLLQGGFGGVGTVRVLTLEGALREPVAAVDPAGDVVRLSGGTEWAAIDDPAVVGVAWSRGVLGASAELIGLSRQMLAMTVTHVSSRIQFGVPIGSFQAVKHQLATALLQVEFAAPVVAGAAAALASGRPDAHRDVSTAKALTSDAARLVARTAIHCHGALGFTTEYDLHLFAKRAWALAADWGSAAWHRAHVAADLGLPVGRTPLA